MCNIGKETEDLEQGSTPMQSSHYYLSGVPALTHKQYILLVKAEMTPSNSCDEISVCLSHAGASRVEWDW